VWRVASGSPAERAGVRPGWIVQRIGDTQPDSAIAALNTLRDARLRRTLAIQVTARLQSRFEGMPDSSIAADFIDARGTPRQLVMQRQPLPGTPVKLGYMPTFVVSASSWRIPDAPVADSCIGVVRFNYWLLPVMQELASAMPSLGACAGIVIDLRGNVGGLAAMLSGVSGFLVDSPITLAVVRSRGQELRYDVFPRRADAQGNRWRPYDGPIAILVDALTVSTSEIFAASMRHVTGRRTRLFGERTAGQALPALASRLPSGDVLMHAIGDLRLSSGARIEGEGVRPDVELPLRRADLLAGRDAAMEAALHWIGQQPRRPARGLAG
jgi:carboxyl-terminal processing protease